MIQLFTASTLLLTFVVISFSCLLLLWHQKVKKYHHLPTPKYMLPFLGHIMRLPRDISKIFDFQLGMFDETKSKLRVLWITSMPLVGFYDVKMMEDVLKSNSILSKGSTYEWIAGWLGAGLLTSRGEKWKSRRRLLTPAFHFGILKSNVSVINHHASCLVDHLKEKVKINSHQDMQSLLKQFSLAIICETAMGIRFDFSDSSKSKSQVEKYLSAVNEILQLLSDRFLKPWLQSDIIFKYISVEGKRFYNAVDRSNNFIKNVFESRIKDLEVHGSIDSSIFIDILIDAYKKNEIDVDGILEEINTFMFAGHDTVSTALAWTLYSLGKHQQVQNKLYDEIHHLRNNKIIDKDSVNQLKYLDCVVKEGLRLYPPAPIIARTLEEDATLGEHLIPAGAMLVMHIFRLHRDKDVWENPTSFQPERFLNYDSQLKNPFAYVPFSAGSRNCIGQRLALLNLKIALVHLVNNFEFVSLQEEREMCICASAVLFAKDGIVVQITSR